MFLMLGRTRLVVDSFLMNISLMALPRKSLAAPAKAVPAASKSCFPAPRRSPYNNIKKKVNNIFQNSNLILNCYLKFHVEAVLYVVNLK
jgi:hypothetical protein